MEERNLTELTEENIAYANEIVNTTSPLVIQKSINGEVLNREERIASKNYFAALNLLKKAKRRSMIA